MSKGSTASFFQEMIATAEAAYYRTHESKQIIYRLTDIHLVAGNDFHFVWAEHLQHNIRGYIATIFLMVVNKYFFYCKGPWGSNIMENHEN